MVNTSQQNLVQTVQLRIFFSCGHVFCSLGILVRDIPYLTHRPRHKFVGEIQFLWYPQTKFVPQNPFQEIYPPISPSVPGVVLVITAFTIANRFPL